MAKNFLISMKTYHNLHSPASSEGLAQPGWAGCVQVPIRDRGSRLMITVLHLSLPTERVQCPSGMAGAAIR